MQGDGHREQTERARAAALRLLTHRARSTVEMRSRLLAKGLPESIVETEIDSLQSSGLLDDDAFAREKAESLVRRGLGPRGCLARLSAAGVDAEAARSALDQVLEEEGGELSVARRVVERRYGDLGAAAADARAKAARYLVRRGFSSSVAGAVCGIFSDETD